MDKFTKMRDGDFWVLDTKLEDGTISEGVLITKETPEEIDCVKLYLWGADGNEFMENNPYTTPKDFLVSIVKKHFDTASNPYGSPRKLVTLKYMEKPQRSMGMFTVTVNKGTSKEQSVMGITEDKAILNSLDFLPSSILMAIINQETKDCVVPVYCQEDNPKDLTINGNYADVLQIGYALVDTNAMKEDTLYIVPEDAVEDFLFLEKDNKGEEFGFEYYIWDEVDQSWQFEESGEGFIGDDPMTNGFFEENGYEWENARLDEYWIEEGEDNDKTEGRGESIASMFGDEDDNLDWGDDDFEDWDDEEVWISE